MKKMGVLAIGGLMVLSFSVGAFGDDLVKKITADYRLDVTVVAEGKVLELKNTANNPIYPINYNGTIYLPVRTVGEALGKKIAWDAATNTVTIGKGLPVAVVQTEVSNELKSYMTRCTDILDEIEKVEIPDNHDDKVTIFKAIKEKVTVLEADLLDFEKDFKDDYRLGRIDTSKYTTLTNDMARLRSKVEDIKKAMTTHFNMSY